MLKLSKSVPLLLILLTVISAGVSAQSKKPIISKGKRTLTIPTALPTSSSQKKKQTTTAASTVATKEYKVPGIQAWDEAKKHGFRFFPERSKGNRTGVGEFGIAHRKGRDERLCSGEGSQIVGGVNMLLYPCFGAPFVRDDGYAFFYLFSSKNGSQKLMPGWTIKTMTFTGSYQWTNRKYTSNTNKIWTKLKLTSSRHQGNSTTAMLKEIVLVGPKNGRWQDAFGEN